MMKMEGMICAIRNTAIWCDDGVWPWTVSSGRGHKWGLKDGSCLANRSFRNIYSY